MKYLKYLPIFALFLVGQLSAAIIKINFNVALNKHTFYEVELQKYFTEDLIVPILGKVSLYYNQDDTFSKPGENVLHNWTSSYRGVEQLPQYSSGRTAEMDIDQTVTSSGVTTKFRADDSGPGLVIGFQEKNGKGTGLGFDNYFFSALSKNYKFGVGLTSPSLNNWQGNATIANVSSIPLPAAFWLFGSGLWALLAKRKAIK